MPRTVTLPDGTQYSNVPDDVTDSEVLQKHVSRQVKEPEEEIQIKPQEEVDQNIDRSTDLGDFAQDTARVLVKTGVATNKAIADVANTVGRFLGKEDKVITDDFRRATTKQFVSAFAPLIPGLDVEDVIDAQGNVQPTETLAGTGLEIAPYVVGGTAIAGSKLLANTPRIVQGILSGVAIDQLLYTGENALANTLSESELFEAESMAQSLVEYLSVDKDDTALEERTKLLAEGVALGVGAEAIMGTAKLVSKARQLFNKSPNQLSRSEEAEVVAGYLKDARQTTQLRAQAPDVVYSETAEGVAQVAQQNSSKLRRFTQQVFTSRGYWTPQAFNAFNDAQYAQRQVVKEAENISNRLQQSLRALGDETKTAAATQNVQKALREDLGFHPQVAQEARIRYVVDNYDVSEDVAKEILNARQLIDNLSGRLANSNIPNGEFRESILENSGEYIRRSYRLFEDSGYKPSESVVRQAEDYLVGQQLKRGLNHDEAYEVARGKIDEILAQGDRTAAEDYYSKVRRVNTEILKERKEIPAEIRALMGEIEEPAENIVLTVSKLAKLTENNQFFNNLNQLGNNKYIFTKPVEREGVSYSVKITGTNSVLDGKYTTPEMLTAIKEKESHMGSFDSGFFRNLAAIKGSSQKMKTIYSHVTHLRNASGGAQFGITNGMNPFSSGNTTAQALKNSIARGGDEELDAMYEKYLRLGIINTNVRVNEFRALLETGFESGPDTLVDKLGQKVKGYGFLQKGDKLATDMYMAVDDFYKVNAFEHELDYLRRALPNESQEVLESEAARIVQNTFPNYDRVPKGIKSLRYLPVGNFVAFPTEIWRTSTNIIKQASKEMNSGNAELVRRGQQRLAGFTTMLAAPSFVATQTAQFAGFNEEESEAIQTLSRTPWSDAPKNVVRVGDKIYTNDTQFIDSYSPLKEPVMAALDRIQSGELRGEELDTYLGDAILDATSKLLTPYLGESMVTESLRELYVAGTGDGRTSKGLPVFVQGMDNTEKAIAAFTLIVDPFLPGSASSGKGVYDAYFETPNRTTGKPKSLQAELVTNLTGARFSEFDASSALMYKIKEYNRLKREVISSTPTYVMKAEAAYENQIKRQEALYELQQDMYENAMAAETLLGTSTTIEVMKDNGLSNKDIGFLLSGRFKPEKYSFGKTLNFIEKVGMESSVLNDIFRSYGNMIGTPLMPVTPEEREEAFDRERERFAKGGRVMVPNAPLEPDERIDKMTGQPYNIQAGSAFVDEEDPEKRMLFNEGGFVDRIKKAGYDAAAKALGVPKEGLEWAMNIDKKYPKAEQLDGRGDAARHLALGVVAQKANYPEATRFLANLREFVELDVKGGAMDIANNNKGFKIKADSYEDAEDQIMKMIRNKEVLYYTPKESKSRRGYQAGGSVEDPSMYRSDGSKKSAQGFLGPVKNNAEGGIMTEVSVGMEINGKEMEVPVMVPTLTKKEIETLANMELEGNAKNIPESIIMKAKQHALQRIEQGLSPFYQDGEK
jgi:hypothetical protein